MFRNQIFILIYSLCLENGAAMTPKRRVLTFNNIRQLTPRGLKRMLQTLQTTRIVEKLN